MVHIYCGDGKGKTTAAIGLAVRAKGRSFRVVFAQFLKSAPSGELEPLRQLGIEIYRAAIPAKFTWQMTEQELSSVKKEHDKLFNSVAGACDIGEDTLIVLDELIGAFDKGLIERETVLTFLDRYEGVCEIILTGRNPHDELLKRAGYVTEMRKLKHPMDNGTPARNGVEM